MCAASDAHVRVAFGVACRRCRVFGEVLNSLLRRRAKITNTRQELCRAYLKQEINNCETDALSLTIRSEGISVVENGCHRNNGARTKVLQVAVLMWERFTHDLCIHKDRKPANGIAVADN